jgi:molybdate transport system substrate-binding protein
MYRRTLICLAALPLFSWAAAPEKTPMKILATLAVQGALADIEPSLSPIAGVPVKFEFAATLALIERLAKGETADMVILTKEGAQQLAAKGSVRSQTDLVVSLVGIAVADNAATPVMKTSDDLVAFLKATPSIAYTARGASGLHMAQVIEKLGLTGVVKPKATIVNEGFSGTLLREGKVAAAVQQVSELKLAGAKNIVPLPDALQSRTIFTAAVLNGTTHADATARVLRALTSPEAAAAYVRSGVTPVFK